MRTTTVFVFFLVICTGWCAEIEVDNKATESKTSSVVTMKETEKVKTEKRAPLVMTTVPGEVKYTPDIKYTPDMKYSPLDSLVKYSSGQDLKQIPNFYQPVPKTQFLFYNPPPPPPQQHQQMVLMFAVPHPSGQFLMLLPAQNFLYPMFYRPQIQHAPVPQFPVHHYSAPALAQSAGFAAQQQLAYSGPYRPEKYSSSKQQ